MVAPNRINSSTINNEKETKKRSQVKKEKIYARPNVLLKNGERPFSFIDEFVELKTYQEKRGMIAKDGSWAIAVGPHYSKSGIILIILII